MKQNAFCPISEKQINEKATRINAFFTVLLVIACCYSQNIYIAVFLAIDFFIRAIDLGKYSLINKTSGFLVQVLPLKKNLINAGPKLFAAKIGFTISSLLVLSVLLHLQTLSFVLFAILGLFSFLEFSLGFCVACVIYPYVYKLAYKKSFPNKLNFKQYDSSNKKQGNP